MQRLSNAALSLVLILFVSAVSLALIVAAWLMATHVLNGPVRSSIPKWLFISLLTMGLHQSNAQTSTTDTFVVTESYTKQLTDQPIVSRATITSSDTLSRSDQRTIRRQKRRLSPRPDWSSDNLPPVATPAEPDMSSVFYIMAVAPNPSVYKTGYWFRSRP